MATVARINFTPPNRVFGPVWTILYLVMGIAAFLVWQKGLQLKEVRVALGWFLVQLILYALWAPVFFGLHRIGWVLAAIVLLWGRSRLPRAVFHEFPNGRLRAMDYGRVTRDRIVLNESSMWSGEKYEASKYDVYLCLPEIGPKLFGGEIDEDGNTRTKWCVPCGASAVT